MFKAYSCYNVNEKNRMRSSSGGVYYLIAKLVIEKGGHVFAAKYTDNLSVNHVEITTLDQIVDTQGSKYVESVLGDTFNKIKDLLINNELVLFVSTPCHCAGLLSFLSVKYDNLICVDFICQGIPSDLIWHKYLESMSKHGKSIKNINMRDKVTGWTKYQYSVSYQDKEGRHYIQKKDDDAYIKGFISCLFLRPSCYECQFKGIERRTDITLGDCWGIWEVDSDFDDNKGVSLIQLHTSKGLDVFEEIKTYIIYRERDINDFLEFNRCIIETVSEPVNRTKFFERIHTSDYIELINEMLKVSFRTRMTNWLLRVLKK